MSQSHANKSVNFYLIAKKHYNILLLLKMCYNLNKFAKGDIFNAQSNW